MPEGPEVFIAAMCGTHFSEHCLFCKTIYQASPCKSTDVSEEDFEKFKNFGLEWIAVGKRLQIRLVSSTMEPLSLYVS